jgi:hypothetical protein
VRARNYLIAPCLRRQDEVRSCYGPPPSRVTLPIMPV